MTSLVAQLLSLTELLDRARVLASSGERRILGITGAPGAGKSTLCTALIEALGSQAVLVGMDGFHLANAELPRLRRRQRKGAPDTFDVDGYAALLGRLRNQDTEVIYAPVFDRGLEESIGSAIPVRREVPLVITEGNYLLHDGAGWQCVRDLLDEVWFLDIKHEVRVARLVARRLSYGHTVAEAEAWALGSDQTNALLIDATKDRADLIVHLTTQFVEDRREPS